MARLKSCPDTKQSFPQPVKLSPETKSVLPQTLKPSFLSLSYIPAEARALQQLELAQGAFNFCSILIALLFAGFSWSDLL
jgi:hypothetical protein